MTKLTKMLNGTRCDARCSSFYHTTKLCYKELGYNWHSVNADFFYGTGWVSVNFNVRQYSWDELQKYGLSFIMDQFSTVTKFYHIREAMCKLTSMKCTMNKNQILRTWFLLLWSSHLEVHLVYMMTITLIHPRNKTTDVLFNCAYRWLLYGSPACCTRCPPPPQNPFELETGHNDM